MGDLPCFASGFHSISNGNVLGPNVKLPFSSSNKTRKNVARMNPYPHIDANTMFVPARKKVDKRVSKLRSSELVQKIG